MKQNANTAKAVATKTTATKLPKALLAWLCFCAGFAVGAGVFIATGSLTGANQLPTSHMFFFSLLTGLIPSAIVLLRH